MTKKVIVLGCVLCCVSLLFGCTSSNTTTVKQETNVENNNNVPVQTTAVETRVDENAYMLINSFVSTFLSANQVTEAKKLSDEECKKANQVCGYKDELYTYYLDKDYTYITMIKKNDDNIVRTVRERINDEQAAKQYANNIVLCCDNAFLGATYDTFFEIITDGGDRIYYVEMLQKDNSGAYTGKMVSVDVSYDGTINSLSTYTDKKEPTATKSVE